MQLRFFVTHSVHRLDKAMASAQRFEKIGEGAGYIWGSGSGYLEYTVPDARIAGRSARSSSARTSSRSSYRCTTGFC